MVIVVGDFVGGSARSAHGPGAGRETDGAIRLDGQGCAETFAERVAVVGVERGDVGGADALTAEEGRPIVVEVAEVGGDVDGAGFDIAQPGGGPEMAEP